MKFNISHTVICSLLPVALCLVSCEENNNQEETHALAKERVSGYIQKGPFINGTSINAAGLNEDLPDFEKYIIQFIENTEFEVTEGISYPEYSEYGENILFGDKSVFHRGTVYSMAAELPKGAELTIRLSGGIWGYDVLPHGPVNWDVSDYDWEAETQSFTAIESGTHCDLRIMFEYYSDSTLSGEGILVEYFENLSDIATRTKLITIEKE